MRFTSKAPYSKTVRLTSKEFYYKTFVFVLITSTHFISNQVGFTSKELYCATNLECIGIICFNSLKKHNVDIKEAQRIIIIDSYLQLHLPCHIRKVESTYVVQMFHHTYSTTYWYWQPMINAKLMAVFRFSNEHICS